MDSVWSEGRARGSGGRPKAGSTPRVSSTAARCGREKKEDGVRRLGRRRACASRPLPAEVDEVNEGGEIFHPVGQQVSRGVRGRQDVSGVVWSLTDGGPGVNVRPEEDRGRGEQAAFHECRGHGVSPPLPT